MFLMYLFQSNSQLFKSYSEIKDLYSEARLCGIKTRSSLSMVIPLVDRQVARQYHARQNCTFYLDDKRVRVQLYKGSAKFDCLEKFNKM